MTTLRDTLNAIGNHLTQAGVVYWPGQTQEYTNPGTQPPLYAKRLPETPQTCAAINAYSLTIPANTNTPGMVIRFQVRSRAPQDADPLADSILNALHGAHHQEWDGLSVGRITHLSTAQLGADPQTGLDERTDNYELITH